MRHSKLRLDLLVVLCLIASMPADPPAAGPAANDDTPALAVRNWLVLDPVAWPLPAFSGEEGGTFGVDGILEAPGLDPRAVRPAPRETVAEFGGDVESWRGAQAAAKGGVRLDPPGDGSTPAVAWLAVQMQVERWAEVRIELTGRHPRRAWVDGEPVARSAKAGGEEDPAPEPASGKVGLETGKHLLLVATVFDPSLAEPWAVGATLTATGDVPAAEIVQLSFDPLRDVTIADVLDAPTVGDMALSPDGKRLANSVERVVPGTDEKESWIEIRDTDSGRLLETWRGESEASHVSWSPDGSRLAWIGEAAAKAKKKGEGEDEPSSIWVRDETSRATRDLTGPVVGLSSYRWTPSGESIVYLVTEKATQDERGVKRLRSIMDRWATFRDKQHAFAVTVPEGVRRRVTAGDWSVAVQDVSPGGGLLATREVEDVRERPYSRVELWDIDLGTLDARKLRDFHWLDAARWSPDGSTLAVVSQPAAFGAAGVDLAPDVIPNSYDAQLFLWNPESGETRAVSRDFDASVSQVEWSRHDGRIYLTALDGSRKRLYRFDPGADGGTFEPLDTGLDVVDSFALAAAAPVAVVRGTSPWEPQALVAVDLVTGRHRRLHHPADSRFASVRRGSIETWTFEASSGRTIPGHVYLPPGFDPSRKYPCIVYYYGGTLPVDRDFGGRYPKEWWAANGYVVYVLEPSGAIGYGQEVSAAHVNDWGETTSREIIEGTRAFLGAHPYVDPERVGAIGASYGGFMTMLLVTETDMFAAVVAHAGISSIASYWGEGYWGYSYSAVATAGSFPWNRPDIYVDKSPLFRADRVKTPILLTHGRADTNVPVGESDQFFVALKLLGAPVEYVQVEGEDHWILTHAKRLVWSKTIVAWFDRWLKGRPEWWNALYPD